MTGGQYGLMRWLRRFLSPAEELEAEDPKEQSHGCGASPLSECCDHSRVRVQGTVRWVTSPDMGGVGVLLIDGTDSIGLNQTGRRRLDCITPGCDFVVQGRVSSSDNGRIIYNPEFKVIS